MIHKIKLKNADDYLLLDEKGYKYLTEDPAFKNFNIIDNIRKHASGRAFFQKSKTKNGKTKMTTLYIHKVLVEKFIRKRKDMTNVIASYKNGSILDCRIENLTWLPRSLAMRKKKARSKCGYTGVYEENGRFRAVIAIDGKSSHIGMYPTAEEAAMAYNKQSRILYGAYGKINLIKLLTHR